MKSGQIWMPEAEFHPVHIYIMLISKFGANDSVPLPGRTASLVNVQGPFFQTNKPVRGGARHCGNTLVPAKAAFSSRWASIFRITAGSSMLAIILTAPPHSLQVSMLKDAVPIRWTDGQESLCLKVRQNLTFREGMDFLELISKYRMFALTCKQTCSNSRLQKGTYASQ